MNPCRPTILASGLFNATNMVPAAIEAWSDLYVASAGASAALAGLVFVAISINVEAIVNNKGLPDMGLVTIMLLVGVLVVSLFGLIPDQSNQDLGTELLVQSIIWTVAIGWFAIRSLPDENNLERSVSRLGLPALGTLPYVAGAIFLVSGSDTGMYFIFAGMIGAVLAAVMDAWILLVEIRR